MKYCLRCGKSFLSTEFIAKHKMHEYCFTLSEIERLREMESELETLRFVVARTKEFPESQLKSFTVEWKPGIKFKDLEREVLATCIDFCEGQTTRAGKLLGMASTPYYNKLLKYGLEGI